METYLCKVCGHISFDSAPVDCPVCRAAIENFEKNPEAIKSPADTEDLNDMEKEHIPVVSVSKQCPMAHKGDCRDIRVSVGEVAHVMENEHYITFIDFYIDKRYLARISFTYKRLYPAALLHLREDRGRLTVIENCNVHGYWMTEMTLDAGGPESPWETV